MIFEIKDLSWLGKQQQLNYQINQGERLCIRGASGSGKTTFLKFFNLFAQPETGKIHYQQQLLTSYQPDKLRQQIVMNPQQATLFGPTIEADLTLWAKLHQQPLPTQAQLTQLLTAVGISLPLTSPVQQLSGGEQQRIALIRTLLTQAPVILLDEPTSALDATSEQAVAELLQHPQFAQTTFLIVSHSERFCQQVATKTLNFDDRKVSVW